MYRYKCYFRGKRILKVVQFASELFGEEFQWDKIMLKNRIEGKNSLIINKTLGKPAQVYLAWQELLNKGRIRRKKAF